MWRGTYIQGRKEFIWSTSPQKRAQVSKPRARSGLVRIDPLRYLAGCRKRRLNQALFYILACFVCCCLLGPAFYVSLICVGTCSVFLVVLVKFSVLAKWLTRKTPLRKPNRGERIVSTKPKPKSVYDFLSLLYCFIGFIEPYIIYLILLWHDIAC